MGILSWKCRNINLVNELSPPFSLYTLRASSTILAINNRNFFVEISALMTMGLDDSGTIIDREKQDGKFAVVFFSLASLHVKIASKLREDLGIGRYLLH